ncbi:MAG TPA: hypothetical protein VFE15_14210 [Marmoricola sp.]|nr:hypothetical protein [Marmoricola sp.]
MDGPRMVWTNGTEAYENMAPAFRENLGGDDDARRQLLAKFWCKVLWVDPVTSRRIEHQRVDAGYLDLSEAYHDSVEEAYFRSGDCTLSAEGHKVGGDYFWRPPGWVHKAWSDGGFDTIICMEGEVASEESGRVSRVICADDHAGHQDRDGVEGGIGPRGYVRQLESRYMNWRSFDSAVVGLTAPELLGKTLSANADTGACTVLVQAPAGWSEVAPTVPRERFIVNTAGSMTVDGQELGECSLVRIPAGEAGPTIGSAEGVELFIKVCEAT